MVGPGVAIEPTGGRTTVVSPVGGKVVKIHPHAFVVLADCGAGVLVHLGIDTNRLEGDGFDVVGERGLSAVVPVVLMDAPKGSVSSPLTGGTAEPGDVLFTV